jgi:uncharacterized membrane protein
MSFPCKEPGASAGRIHVLDFLRLAAILLMIQGHTLDALVDPARMDLGAVHWQVWVHLRGLTAPMFMLVSGAATVLGIRYDAAGRLSLALIGRRIRTAFMVIGIGYLMVFPAGRIADLRWVSPEVWRHFLNVNILQANGVTLLLVTLLLCCTRTVRRYAAWSLAIGCLILLAAPLAASVDWFRLMPEGWADYLSYGQGSLFPLIPTSAYMFLGVPLGALLLEIPAERRARVFRLVCLAAGGAVLLFSLVARHVPLALIPPAQAWQGGYAYTSLRLGYALLVFGALAWIAELRPGFAAACAPMGRRSLFAYVGHLTLIFGTPWTLGFDAGRFHTLSVGQGALAVLLVGGLTFGAIRLWDWLLGYSRHLGTLVYASALIALVSVLIW